MSKRPCLSLILGLLLARYGGKLVAATAGSGNARVLASEPATAPQSASTVAGKVSDDSGRPVAGAAVLQKTTADATVTAADGSFTLTGLP
jgi:hypothetical protein